MTLASVTRKTDIVWLYKLLRNIEFIYIKTQIEMIRVYVADLFYPSKKTYKM